MLRTRATRGHGARRLRRQPGISEVASGQPLGAFLQARLFAPLGMKDLFVVYMMQSPKQRAPHRAALRELVYGAVIDAKVAARP